MSLDVLALLWSSIDSCASVIHLFLMMSMLLFHLQDDTAFEKQTALFALAVSDIVLINMWVNDFCFIFLSLTTLFFQLRLRHFAECQFLLQSSSFHLSLLLNLICPGGAMILAGSKLLTSHFWKQCFRCSVFSLCCKNSQLLDSYMLILYSFLPGYDAFV